MKKSTNPKSGVVKHARYSSRLQAFTTQREQFAARGTLAAKNGWIVVGTHLDADCAPDKLVGR
jgi:hypothetical protein